MAGSVRRPCHFRPCRRLCTVLPFGFTSPRTTSLALRSAARSKATAMVNLYPTLDPDGTIWRYMPLEQFLAILATRTLHFQPMSKMLDLAERFSPATVRERLRDQSTTYPAGISSAHDVNKLDAQQREAACISCWHMNADESAAMWSLHAQRKGIAIRSTVRRFQSSFKEFPGNVMIAPIKYYSAADDDSYNDDAFYGNLFIKWKSYEHEHELRALTFSTDGGQPYSADSGIDGINLPIEPSQLIEHLFVSPEVPNWIVSVVRETVKRYSFAFPIDKSTMNTLT